MSTRPNFGCETQVHTGQDRLNIAAVEMDNLRSVFAICRIVRIKNEDVREICGVKRSLKKAHGRMFFRMLWSFMVGIR